MAALKSARERFEALARNAPREQWFATLRAAIAEYYLADPADPYRQSGRSQGAARWEQTRRLIADAVDRDGDFMDVGCANGLLLESMIGWSAERGHRLRPHGVDFVPELIALARARHPGHEASFETTNAYYWLPRRTWDFVRVSLEIVPPADRIGFAERIFELAVAPGGRLIACYYGVDDDPDALDPGSALEALGLAVTGRSHAPNVAIAWCDKPHAKDRERRA